MMKWGRFALGLIMIKSWDNDERVDLLMLFSGSAASEETAVFSTRSGIFFFFRSFLLLLLLLRERERERNLCNDLMEQAIEEASRAGSRDVTWTGISNVKLEENRDESPWMLVPAEGQLLEVPQEYVGENDFTEGGRRKRWSEVWKDFTEEKKPDGSTGARCKHCLLLLSASSNSGTSHLNRHIKLHCPTNRYRDARPKAMLHPSATLKQYGDYSKEFKLDQDVSRRNLAKLVISAGLPFDIVEQPEFFNFVKSLQPSFQFVGKEIVRRDCVILYEEERNKIHNMLKNLNSRVSFTFDMWVSEQDVGYMALYAQFIDCDFVLRKKILNFRRIAYPHASNDEIAKCIGEWELDEKVFALVLDDSTTNDILVTRLKENLGGKLLASGNYLHIISCANFLNSVVEDGLKVLHLAVEHIRNIVKHVISTPSCMQAFNECAQQFRIDTDKGLFLDVSTEWNTTYDLLESALYYKEALIRYALIFHHCTDAPTHDDWEKTEAIMKFLKPFVNAINVLSRANFPTANLYFREIWTIRQLLQDEIFNCDEVVRNLTLEMQTKFKKYWNECNMILAIASILDPRFKFLFVQYCYESAFDEEHAKVKVKEIRDCLYKLYNDYEKALKVVEQSMPSESSRQVVSALSESPSTLTGKRKLESEFATYLSQNLLKRAKRNEMDAYLEDDVLPTMDDEDFSILIWWEKSADVYPVLSMMARDILAIPVSSVTSKSAFRAWRKLIDQYSKFVDSSMVETLICSQEWLHADYHPDVCPDFHASSVVDEELFDSCLPE